MNKPCNDCKDQSDNVPDCIIDGICPKVIEKEVRGCSIEVFI